MPILHVNKLTCQIAHQAPQSVSMLYGCEIGFVLFSAGVEKQKTVCFKRFALILKNGTSSLWK